MSEPMQSRANRLLGAIRTYFAWNKDTLDINDLKEKLSYGDEKCLRKDIEALDYVSIKIY